MARIVVIGGGWTGCAAASAFLEATGSAGPQSAFEN
jgi:NADH dehydrogenase FAD-containing subunit